MRAIFLRAIIFAMIAVPLSTTAQYYSTFKTFSTSSLSASTWPKCSSVSINGLENMSATAALTQPLSLVDHDRQYYLRKSRRQKTIGWILLGGGTVLTALSLVVAQTYANTNSSNSDAGPTILAVAGLGSMIGSIPVFISAGHNRTKAAALSASAEKISFPVAMDHHLHFMPTLQLAVNL